MSRSFIIQMLVLGLLLSVIGTYFTMTDPAFNSDTWSDLMKGGPHLRLTTDPAGAVRYYAEGIVLCLGVVATLFTLNFLRANTQKCDG